MEPTSPVEPFLKTAALVLKLLFIESSIVKGFTRFAAVSTFIVLVVSIPFDVIYALCVVLIANSISVSDLIAKLSLVPPTLTS